MARVLDQAAGQDHKFHDLQRQVDFAPGIRLPATKVCEHTWDAAQRVAAPRYTKLAVILASIAAITLALGLIGVSEGLVLGVWLGAAIVSQIVMLSGAGRDAATAAAAVRCEHQRPPEPERPYRATRKARPRGGSISSGVGPATRAAALIVAASPAPFATLATAPARRRTAHRVVACL